MLMSTGYLLVLICLGRNVVVEIFKGVVIAGIVTTGLIFPLVVYSRDQGVSVTLLLCLMLLSVAILILFNRSNIVLLLRMIRGDGRVP